MVRYARAAASPRWLLPALVVLLVLGHACDLPAYAALISDHATMLYQPADSHHDESDEHSLTCEATLVIPSHSGVVLPPILTAPVMLAGVLSVVPTRPHLPAKADKLATGPPLFLLLSSLLI